MATKKLLILCFLSISFAFCKNQKKASQADSQYDDLTKVMVVDLSGLDGCSFALQLEDESVLLPFEGMPEGWEQSGSVYFVSFEEAPDVPSICMRGKVVKIIKAVAEKG